jgi:lactaldehyde reductase
MCFGNAMVGGVHATAHALGAHYHVPHGLANAIMLPIVMEFNAEEAADRYLMIADAMGLSVSATDASEAARAAVQAVRDLKSKIGLTETLKDFNVPAEKESLMPTVELAAGDSQVSYNPRYLEDDDILNLYLKAL